MATTLPPGRVEGRVPPHDLEAEASVLGALLLDPTAVTRVLDLIDPEDFYRENNGQIFRAATALFREGEPIDNITLAAELEKMGLLERVGGRAHLAMLQEQTPTAGNIEHYARIVRDRAYKRRLITAGGHVTALGFEESLDAEEAVNQAQAEVFGISDQRVGSSMERLYDLLKPAMDRIDNQMASGGGVVGVATGFHDLDRITNGFKPSDMVVIAARPSMGKALALDTPIPTPTGWTTMGTLRVGDQVFDERGVPCTITFATSVMHRRRCYEVVFSDGERIVADAEHRWLVRIADRAGAFVTTTADMARTLLNGDGGVNFTISLCGPLQYPDRELPGDPYTLGACLADGAGAGSAAGGAVAAVAVDVVPRIYLESSAEQRLALLQGLMDAGGDVDEDGRPRFASTSLPLARSVMELAAGMGMAVTRVEAGAHHLVRFAPTDMAVFRVPAKLARLREGGSASRERSVLEVRDVESVPVRCIQVSSPSHLYLAGRGCVPTHNTSFVLNVALHAAVEHQQPVAIFSLEMSKEQLVERMLCEHARIDAQRLHRGLLSEAEHERLVYSLGPLGDAPIYIDDAPMLDDLSLRLKARQARAREGIELIIIDYLQLMHGRSRGGGDDSNRVQEVSAISRSLKGIARELQVPVIALSQLSRAPEQRPDKRPILSDLRESGCLTDDTRLLRADTGAPVSIRELLDGGCEGVLVWSLDEERRMTPAPLLKVFPSGVKRVFRLRLASGREVKASANHRFLMHDGWRELGDLQTGDRIATPRHVPAPVQPVAWNRLRLGLLAHLIGDGCTLARQPLHYTNADLENIEFVEQAAQAEFGITPRRVAQDSWHHVYLPAPTRLTWGKRNPIAAWMDELGVFGLRSYEKRIPTSVFASSDEDVAYFLRHLWATDGCVSDRVAERGGSGVYYASSSRLLADDVSQLLLRLGIRSRTHSSLKAGTVRPTYQVWVKGVDQLRIFAERIGVHGARGRQLNALVPKLELIAGNTNVDTLPIAVWGDVRAEMTRTRTTTRALATGLGMSYCGTSLYKSAPSRERLARVAVAVGSSALLQGLATDDVFWDRVVAIEDLGEQPVYDGTVAGTHNFIADGIVAHNSIEQDADLVMFLYRDEYYNREKSEKPGIAEIIVAKHRNGPTGMIELIFRKELTRFENLDRRRPEGAGMGPDE